MRETGRSVGRGGLGIGPWAAVLHASVVLLASATPAASDASLPPGDPAYGEYLSSQCVTCHPGHGPGEGGIPPIVGLSSTDFVDALLAYRSGRRENQVMRNVTSVLGDEEIAALAAYFATLPHD